MSTLGVDVEEELAKPPAERGKVLFLTCVGLDVSLPAASHAGESDRYVTGTTHRLIC